MAQITDIYRRPKGKLSGVGAILFGLLFIPVADYLLPRTDLMFLTALGLWCAILGVAEVLPKNQTTWAGRIRIVGWLVLFSILGAWTFVL